VEDRGVRAKLYVILGSHAARTGILMLEHKGIPYRTRTIPTGSQRLLRLRGFPGGTVPALVIDGRRVQTNLAIARALDRIDAWIESGVLGGERLNAADYAIASSAALLTYRGDLRPEVEARPVGALVDRVLPAP
jgi:glutathione S-transferase